MRRFFNTDYSHPLRCGQYRLAKRFNTSLESSFIVVNDHSKRVTRQTWAFLSSSTSVSGSKDVIPTTSISTLRWSIGLHPKISGHSERGFMPRFGQENWWISLSMMVTAFWRRPGRSSKPPTKINIISSLSFVEGISASKVPTSSKIS